jgi:hypothetical protein
LNIEKVGQVAQEVNLNFDNSQHKAVILTEDLGPNPWFASSSFLHDQSFTLGMESCNNVSLAFYERAVNATKFFIAFDNDLLLGSSSSLLKVDDWYLVGMLGGGYCSPRPSGVGSCLQAWIKQSNLDGILSNDFYYNLTYTSSIYS